MKALLVTLLISANGYSQSFNGESLTAAPTPIEIGGPKAKGTIIGNNGDLFGGEFAKIIRVDVYQKLELMFSRGQIPQNHPLYILKNKMARFKALLDDKFRVYAVRPQSPADGVIRDVFGDEVLARVVPLRYPIRRLDQESEKETLVSAGTFSLSEFQRSGLDVLTLATPGRPINRISFTKEGLVQVRVGGDFIDSHNQPLPPGFIFYSKCSDTQDLTHAIENSSSPATVRLLCNGYRFDGAVATLDGALVITKEKETVQIKAELTVQLELQSYVIEVNGPRFKELLAKHGQKNMQVLVFHEYLRLLGIDDQGYKISVYARHLNDVAAGTKQALYVGDQVLIAKGIASIVTNDQSPTLPETPEGPLNPITYRGVIESIMMKSYHMRQLPFVVDGQQFHVIDSVIQRPVVKIKAVDISPHIRPVQFFWLDDVVPYRIVIKD